MDIQEYKNLFGETAQKNGFENMFGGWFRESNDAIVVLELNKSSYMNLFHINIKTYIKGVFNRKYTISEGLLHENIGDVFLQQEFKQNIFLNLEIKSTYDARKKELESFFADHICKTTALLLDRANLKELFESNKIFIPLGIRRNLGW